MAVVTLYMSDRDSNTTFSDKKAADNYDKMLELAENVSLWVEKSIDGLNEEQIESIGMLIAENKDLLAKAIKSKPEILLQEEAEEETSVDEDKVAQING
jgi:dsDNA-binding SOS-regulon protein